MRCFITFWWHSGLCAVSISPHCWLHLFLLQTLYQLFSDQNGSVALTHSSLERISGYGLQHRLLAHSFIFSLLLSIRGKLFAGVFHNSQQHFVIILFSSAPALLCVLLTVSVCGVFQARQVLEREFNNLLALGTDRRLEEVTSQAAALNKWNIAERGATVWPHVPPCPCRVGMTSLFDALHRGARGFGRVREGRGWAWWQAPWKHCLPGSACHPCPCRRP